MAPCGRSSSGSRSTAAIRGCPGGNLSARSLAARRTYLRAYRGIGSGVSARGVEERNPMIARIRPLLTVALLSAVAVLVAVAAPAAFAALPAGYDVQRIDSPNITAGGDFGIAMVSLGDLNGDGEQDIVIGTDEHGGSVGQIFVLSGEDGSTIRTINAPDTGGTGTLESFGSYVGDLADLGSCAGGSPGATCGLATIGPPDGVPEILVTALGVDVSFTDPDTMSP